MLNVRMDENFFIDPRYSDTPKISTMLRNQGDMRGFLMDDGTLVVFDSYGNTHHSITVMLSRDSGGKRRWIDMGMSLIFRLDGKIWVDYGIPAGGSLAEIFEEKHIRLIEKVYRLIGVSDVRLTNED